MGRKKLSILACLVVIGGCALIFAAMRGANPLWAGVVGSITFFGLAASLLGVGFARGTTRAFWVGFASLGWAYMALTSVPWLAVKVSSVLSIPLFDQIFPVLHSDPEQLIPSSFGGGIRGGMPSGMGGMGGGMGGGFRSVPGGGTPATKKAAAGGYGGGMMGGYGGMMPGNGGGMMMAGGVGATTGLAPVPVPTADVQSFRMIGRNLEALLWAVLGGWIARSFRAQRTASVAAETAVVTPS